VAIPLARGVYWLSKLVDLLLRRERQRLVLESELGAVDPCSATDGDVGGKLRLGLSIELRPGEFLFPK